jgi:hypothetical protein
LASQCIQDIWAAGHNDAQQADKPKAAAVRHATTRLVLHGILLRHFFS